MGENKEDLFTKGFQPICVAILMESWYQRDHHKIKQSRSCWLGEVVVASFGSWRTSMGVIFACSYAKEKYPSSHPVLNDMIGQIEKFSLGDYDDIVVEALCDQNMAAIMDLSYNESHK